MKKLLLGLTLLASISSFASDNSMEFSEKINEVYPTTEMTYEHVSIGGDQFLAQTGEEHAKAEFDKTKKRANAICKFLKHPKGAFSYRINSYGREGDFLTLNGQDIVKAFYSEHFWSGGQVPTGFSSIKCKL